MFVLTHQKQHIALDVLTKHYYPITMEKVSGRPRKRAAMIHVVDVASETRTIFELCHQNLRIALIQRDANVSESTFYQGLYDIFDHGTIVDRQHVFIHVVMR